MCAVRSIIQVGCAQSTPVHHATAVMLSSVRSITDETQSQFEASESIIALAKQNAV
jgi:hypothetical protein